LLCWSCAQQGSPSGGPRDEDPPVVVESLPPNYSVRFEAKKILITFDEFIVLDNVNQELIVSPPMEEKPEVKLRKKTIVIEFEEVLKPNTTYTFNFGSAIKDLHEGNKLVNYEYVFATGDELDSLSVRGTLKYASDLTVPEEPVSIMLYEDLRDSVPLTDIPMYVGRSNDSGIFSVNNLRPDVYKVFALKDGNNNFLFDMPTEEIAFLDSSLIVNADFARRLLGVSDTLDLVSDTLDLVADTLNLIAVTPDRPVDAQAPPLMPGIEKKSSSLVPGTGTDSTLIEKDSLQETGPDLNSIYIDLLLFSEETEIQYITDYTRDDRRMIQMVFARPLTDTFSYKSLPPIGDLQGGVIEYYSSQRDSLTLWIKDSLDYKRDTVALEIRFTVLDTTRQYITQVDTLLFTYREKSTKKRGKEAEVPEPEKLKISTIRKNGEHNLNRDLVLDIDLPLKEFNDSLIHFYHIPDSVEVPEPFRLFADSSLLTRGWISADWKSAAQYKLVLLPGAITSIYPADHDTLEVSFKTRDIEYYGQILLNLEHVQNRVIIQLLNKDKVFREQTVEQSGLYTFPYLVPQEYQIKFIHDLNGNGKWDTGKYMEKLQPEPVEYLPSEVTVRGNWDHDVTMTLEK